MPGGVQKNRTLEDIASVLEFLQNGADKVLQLVPLRCKWPPWKCSSESLVARFFRALARFRPAPAKRFPTWDLSVVLQAFTKEPFETIESISLRNLTFKTIFSCDYICKKNQ